MADLNFQKAALALFLCAPSTLNRAWLKENNDKAVEDELKRLGLDNPDLKAKEVMAALRPHRSHFEAVANKMSAMLWGRGDPHPPDLDAPRIVRAIRVEGGE